MAAPVRPLLRDAGRQVLPEAEPWAREVAHRAAQGRDEQVPEREDAELPAGGPMAPVARLRADEVGGRDLVGGAGVAEQLAADGMADDEEAVGLELAQRPAQRRVEVLLAPLAHRGVKALEALRPRAADAAVVEGHDVGSARGHPLRERL